MRPCGRPGWYWLDADELAAHASKVTGERRRILALAATLLGADSDSPAATGSDTTWPAADRRVA